MKIIKEMLVGEGSRILAQGITTDAIINYYGWGDRDKHLKFVVCKGFIDDWCIYLESMENDQTIEQVKDYGHKIHNPDIIKHLVECSEEVLKRYRQ